MFQTTSSNNKADEGDNAAITGTTGASEKQKWEISITSNTISREDELQKQLQQREQELQVMTDSKEELEQKVNALESQTPVMQKLTSFVSTQRALERENEELRQQLSGTTNNNQTKLPEDGTLLSSSSGVEKEDLIQQISTLQAELKAAKEYNNSTNNSIDAGAVGFTEDEVNNLLDEEQEKYQRELEAMKQEYSVQLTALEAEKKALQDQLQEQQQSTTSTTTDSADVDLIQLQTEIVALRKGHAKEMDEILAQLDMVEAEHKQELERVQTFADEQAAMVTALSHEKSNTSGRDGSGGDDQLHRDLAEAKANAQHWQDKCGEVKAHYKQLLEDERQHTLEEADKARQETIQDAEAQFQQANDLYISLKQEYAECNALKETLEHELVTTRHHHAEDMKEMEQRLHHQIEELQQELSDAQSTALHDKQHFTNELGRFQETYDKLVQELEELRQDYQAMEKTYAHNLAEKERLSQENADLKNVCEETMALMEQYQQQETNVV